MKGWKKKKRKIKGKREMIAKIKRFQRQQKMK